MAKAKKAASAFIDFVTPNKPKSAPLSAAKEAETLSPFQVAQQNAQRNAALPVEQGGLGLRPDNTAEDRLAAQNYYDYLHGTQRLDRLLEGEGLDPKRATSGPMPYGTDKPELASRYATSKADTSRYDAGNMADYFQVAPKDLGARGKNLISVEQSWHYLSPEQKQQILSGYYRTGYANPEEGSGAFTLHPEGTHGSIASKAHLDHVLKEERGNPLAALRNLWGESGELYDNPEDLSQIFKMAGYPYDISQTNAPWTTAQGVMLGKARMDNPLRTSDTDNLINNVIPSLREQFKGDRTRLKVGADQWAKESRYTPNQWLEELEKDVLAGKNSFVWTSIPDKVTGALKQLGHDGIIDLGGKTGGEGHQVVIPFDPTQVRSKFAAFDPMEKSSTDLLKAHGGVVHKTEGGMVDSVPEEAIKNTIKDPQAFRMLDMDLANLALMSQQPRRMAQGGQVQRFDEGGEVSQDQMRYELDRANSPVMQATPRSPIQDFIGTAGGYMDRAGRFITQAIEPIAEKNPVKTFLADMLLAAPLKGAGTLMQDLTGTVRETDEDNPVRGVISKDWKNLTTSREPMLDPRALDIAQFATPVVRGATKLVGAGAKAITPFAKSTAEMAAELYGRGQMPGMVAPNAYMAEPSVPKPAKVLAPANEQTTVVEPNPTASRPEYQGEHQAPMADSGSPLHNVVGAYPEDFYSPNAVRYYGTGDESMDAQSIAIMQGLKNKPNAQVTIYRAIPKSIETPSQQLDTLNKQISQYMAKGTLPEGVDKKNKSSWYDQITDQRDALSAEIAANPNASKPTIGTGDWVTINRAYAAQHGESALNNKYRIISKKVPAKHLFTSGDSPHEFGYDPSIEKAKGGKVSFAPNVDAMRRELTKAK
jgi:hypothetical protein